MHKVRVLQIVPTLGYGGVAQFLLNYYKQMDQSRIVFDFITHGGKESFHAKLIASGSKIYYFQSIGRIGISGYLKQLKDVFETNKYDIVHTHDGHLTGLTAMMCKHYFKGSVFCHAHTTLCVNPKHRPFMPIFRFLSRHYADKLLGCGIKACEYCYGKKANFTVIHNAVSLERFWNVRNEDVDALRESLHIDTNTFVIGHVGLFSAQKNHFYIIRIFEYLLKFHPNTILILVGGGELKEGVEKYSHERGIYENIRFVGIQQNIPLYMHLFDTFILPSLYEGLPVCGVEAQSVVSNVCLADTIDRDVDAGIGSAVFIPITNEAIPIWEQEIFTKRPEINKEIVMECFKAHGYEISDSVQTLFNIYMDEANKN